MSAIHYKSPQSIVTTPCGKGLHKKSIQFTDNPRQVTCARCQKHVDVVRAHAELVASVKQKAEPQRTAKLITFEIEPQMAWALAQFCKRSTFDTFAQHAASKDETYLMRDGLCLVWAALRDNGFDPR